MNLQEEGLHLTTDIAVIGMACRFPGAADVTAFWRNLAAGVESVRWFGDEELAHVPQTLRDDPRYVKARAILDNIELFDAAFFGLNPREAEILDVQQRLFLECAYHALEDAGFDPAQSPYPCGVFAGVGLNSYLINNLLPNRDKLAAGAYQVMISNDKDFAPTRVAYKLNLQGPAVAVQTACSTSLVAIHMACQSLLSGECDVALAGGCTVSLPQKTGYLHEEGMILSPDGHCRPFDAQAAGTVGGDGVGIVVLKRLAEALADRDVLYAVIKGSAVNNDGADKIGYTAPSQSGQAAVIAEALAVAQVEPEEISYIEAHGTGTKLGDPIEVAALTDVFGRSEQKWCAIGSVKSNMGHLDTAAGVAGFIKTVLALKHKQLPPSLHFERPNPEIDFSGPFFVNKRLREWKADGRPRRAGVSSFGIGGTNAHVIVEEAPVIEREKSSEGPYLLPIAAPTTAAIEKIGQNLAAFVREHGDVRLEDVGYTLGHGRKGFAVRNFVVVNEGEEVVFPVVRPPELRTSVGFLFTGQGAQYGGMGKKLYETEGVFRAAVDECVRILGAWGDVDWRHVIFSTEAQGHGEGEDRDRGRDLDETQYTQPGLFVVAYALARLWMAWGVEPTVMMGHSMGEYVAACVAGVFSLEEALKLVALRGRLMGSLPKGEMAAVMAAERVVEELGLTAEVDMAAVNSPESCVISGTAEAIAQAREILAEQKIGTVPLRTSHAFHSRMMAPILQEFAAAVQEARPQAPQRPFVSNVTGELITAAQATDPQYWCDHLRQTVRFGAGLQTAAQQASLLLEVGPGRTLTTLAKQNLGERVLAVQSLPHPQEKEKEQQTILTALGQVWQAGNAIDWVAVYAHKPVRKLSLPLYPFERQRYWIDAPNQPVMVQAGLLNKPVKRPLDEWFYIPSWRRAPLVAANECAAGRWLVFMDKLGLGERLVSQLREKGHEVWRVFEAKEFRQVSDSFMVNPHAAADFKQLWEAMGDVEHIVYGWTITPTQHPPTTAAFNHVMWLAQGVGASGRERELQLTVVTNHVQAVSGERAIQPHKAAVLGALRAMEVEYPQISGRAVDVIWPQRSAWQIERLTEQLMQEHGEATKGILAYRDNQRWEHCYESLQLPATGVPDLLKVKGTYLITGGTGGIGLTLAEYLAETVQANLVLVSRSGLAAADPAVAKLEEAGGSVLIGRADVANAGQMRIVIEEAIARFGSINGVIHAAGIPSGGAMQFKDAAEVEKILAPKVEGAMVLERLLASHDLDFMLLCSSVAAVIGEYGQADYAAANLFLDAFAHQQSRQGQLTMSVNWDTWQEVGMAAWSGVDTERLALGLTSAEGKVVFERVLHGRLPQVVVSTQKLAERQQYNDMALVAQMRPEVAGEAHPRPTLSTPYRAPDNEFEQRVAEIWQVLLGIAPIGRDDNFFDLGGHSLLATQVIVRLRAVLDWHLPLTAFFERPTIAEQADFYLSQQLEALDEDELSSLLAEVEGLSDEELAALLGDE